MYKLTYESFVSNSWTSAVEPSVLVGVSRGNKSSCGNLLCVKTEANVSRAVLAMWNGAGNSLRFESVDSALDG